MLSTGKRNTEASGSDFSSVFQYTSEQTEETKKD